MHLTNLKTVATYTSEATEAFPTLHVFQPKQRSAKFLSDKCSMPTMLPSSHILGRSFRDLLIALQLHATILDSPLASIGRRSCSRMLTTHIVSPLGITPLNQNRTRKSAEQQLQWLVWPSECSRLLSYAHSSTAGKRGRSILTSSASLAPSTCAASADSWVSPGKIVSPTSTFWPEPACWVGFPSWLPHDCDGWDTSSAWTTAVSLNICFLASWP